MLKYSLNLNNTGATNGYITVPIGLDFSPEMNQYDFIENNFDVIKQAGVINETTNYEKIKLTPVDSVDENINISTLQFNLHFIVNNDWTNGATQITNLGFTSDDVKFRRKRVEKSFIRLSFYDTTNPKTQNLLYYSTIFLDANDLYTKYISNNNSMSELKSEFIVENSRFTKKIKSSEGYNLYLFKEDILKNETKTIYLKIEFSNALNGRTTLFTKNKPYTISGYTIKELYENMYFNVNCKLNSEADKYIYWLEDISPVPYTDSDNKYLTNIAKIEAYQAKIV